MKNLRGYPGRYCEPVRGRDDVYDRAGNPSIYNTVCSGNGHDRSCSDNDTSAERRPGDTRRACLAQNRGGGDGEIPDPCTGRQVRCLIKKYRLWYGVPFSGSDGVGSSEETGPGKRGEVLTGKETRRTYHIYMNSCLEGAL